MILLLSLAPTCITQFCTEVSSHKCVVCGCGVLGLAEGLAASKIKDILVVNSIIDFGAFEIISVLTYGTGWPN